MKLFTLSIEQAREYPSATRVLITHDGQVFETCLGLSPEAISQFEDGQIEALLNAVLQGHEKLITDMNLNVKQQYWKVSDDTTQTA